MRWARRGGPKAVRVLAGLALGGSAAQGVTASWSGAGSDNSWQTTANWSGLQPPDQYPGHPQATTSYDVEITDTDPRPTVELGVSVSVLTVHVGAGMTVQVQNGGTLDIGSSEILDLDGTIEVYKGANLTLRAGTHVFDDGIIFFEAGGGSTNPTLTINGAVTFDVEDGAEGRITGGSNVTGVIQEGTSLSRLTIEPGIEIGGGSMEIPVALTNNGLVYAEGPPLILKTRVKNGSGVWEARESRSKLQVDVAVTGSGTWSLPAEFYGGRIEINAACTGLTGELDMYSGTLDINAAFEGCGPMELVEMVVCNSSTFHWGANNCP